MISNSNYLRWAGLVSRAFITFLCWEKLGFNVWEYTTLIDDDAVEQLGEFVVFLDGQQEMSVVDSLLV